MIDLIKKFFGHCVDNQYILNDRGVWFDWVDGDKTATLDGHFTAADLEAIVYGMRYPKTIKQIVESD